MSRDPVDVPSREGQSNRCSGPVMHMATELTRLYDRLLGHMERVAPELECIDVYEAVCREVYNVPYMY